MNDRDQSKNVNESDHDFLSVDTRLSLVRQSIIETAINHSSDRLTIFRSINRTIFAFNGPIVFVFIEKYEDYYSIILEENFEPMNENLLYEAINKMGFKAGKINVNKVNLIENFLIRIFDTDFFIIPLSTKYTKNRESFKQSDMFFEPLSADSTAHAFLSRAFKPFGPSIENLKIGRDFQHHIAKLFDKSTRIKAKHDDPRKNPSPVNIESELSISVPRSGGGRDSIIKKLDDMIYDEINRISDSPLLSSPDELVPNMMVFSKRFTRKSRRFGHYYYDTIPFLPFNIVKNCVEYLNKTGFSKFIKFPDDSEDVINWFKDSVKNKLYSEISKVSMSPLSSGLRLCVDYVMMSGTGLVYYNPFKDGYIGWIDGCSKDEIIHEKKRLCIIHYFLQAGNPSIKNPYLLLLPIRVSGSVYMVTASIVDGDSCDNISRDILSDHNYPLVKSDEFQYRTFLYHDILRNFELRIRRRSKDLYMESVADLISDAVRSSAVRRAEKGGMSAQGPDLSLAEYEALRRRLMLLCRFYPYDPIDIRPSLKEGFKNRGEGAEAGGIALRRMRVAGVAQQVQFALHEGSPFYDRVRLRYFLEPDITQKRLEDMINARFGAWRAYDEMHNA